MACARRPGRAAKRLAETTGREASTIHRLLGFEGTTVGPAATPVIRSNSICSSWTKPRWSICRSWPISSALPANICLVLVGDIDQLPSVGPGMVLRDVIASGVVPVVRLTEIFRQAQESGIVRAAYNVLHGEMPVVVSRNDKLTRLLHRRGRGARRPSSNASWRWSAIAFPPASASILSATSRS